MTVAPRLASSPSVEGARAPRHVPQQSTYLSPAGLHCFRSERTPGSQLSDLPCLSASARPLAASIIRRSTRQGRCVLRPAPHLTGPGLSTCSTCSCILEYYPVPLATFPPSASCLTPLILCCIPPGSVRSFGKARRRPSHDLLACGRRHSRHAGSNLRNRQQQPSTVAELRLVSTRRQWSTASLDYYSTALVCPSALTSLNCLSFAARSLRL